MADKATDEQISEWIEYYRDEENEFLGGILKELLVSRATIARVKKLADEAFARAQDMPEYGVIGREALRFALKDVD